MAILGPVTEVRTVFINWPVEGELRHMWTKQQLHFNNLTLADYGLGPTDGDAHKPHFFLVAKSAATEGTTAMQADKRTTRSTLHARSEIGRRRDAQRKKLRMKQKRKDSALVIGRPSMSSSAAAASASSSSVAALPFEPGMTYEQLYSADKLLLQDDDDLLPDSASEVSEVSSAPSLFSLDSQRPPPTLRSREEFERRKAGMASPPPHLETGTQQPKSEPTGTVRSF